jgi:uncharacterized RDD family membrane protein YckC
VSTFPSDSATHDVDLVTGEAVLLDLHPTSFATRAGAFLIDLVVSFVVLLVLFFVIAGIVAWSAFGGDFALAEALGLVMYVLVIAVIPMTVETLTRGRSLGKMALGIRVVRDDGGPVRFRQAMIRALSGVGELWLMFGSIALIASLTNEKGKRLGDMLAGTYVVRERSLGLVDLRIAMPYELAGWARAADIGRLPDGLAMSLRQFLAQCDKLHPGSRARLGTSLATETAHWVAPPPPPGTHPERFMAAVLAERRDRELARLTREREAAHRRETVLHRLPHGLSD